MARTSLSAHIRAAIHSTSLESNDNEEKIMNNLVDQLENIMDKGLAKLPKTITTPLIGLKYPGVVITKATSEGEVDFVIEKPKMKTNTITKEEDIKVIIEHIKTTLGVLDTFNDIYSVLSDLHQDSFAQESSNDTFSQLDTLSIYGLMESKYINPFSGDEFTGIDALEEILQDHVMALVNLLKASVTTTKPSNESIIGAATIGVGLLLFITAIRAVGSIAKFGIDKLEKLVKKATTSKEKKIIEAKITFYEEVSGELDNISKSYTTKRSTVEGTWVSCLAHNSDFNPVAPMKSIEENIKAIGAIGAAVKKVHSNATTVSKIINGILEDSTKLINRLPKDLRASLEDNSNHYATWVEERYKKAYSKFNRMLPSDSKSIPTFGSTANTVSVKTIPANKIGGVLKDLNTIFNFWDNQDPSDYTFDIDVDYVRTILDVNSKTVNEFYNKFMYGGVESKYNIKDLSYNVYSFLGAAIDALYKSTKPVSADGVSNESFKDIFGKIFSSSALGGNKTDQSASKQLSNEPTPTIKERIAELANREPLEEQIVIDVNDVLTLDGKLVSVEDNVALLASRVPKMNSLLDKLSVLTSELFDFQSDTIDLNIEMYERYHGTVSTEHYKVPVISKLPAGIKASLEDLASPQDRWYQWVGDELTKMHQKYSKQLPRPQPNLTPMLGGKGPSRIDTIPADKIEGVVKHLLEAVELYYEQFEFADLKEWSFEIDAGDFRPFWDNDVVAVPMNKLVDEFYYDELGPKYNLIDTQYNKFEKYLRAVCALVKSSTKQPTGNESFTAVEAGLAVIGGLAVGSVFWSKVKKWLNLEKKEATKSNTPVSTYKTLADTVEELKGRVALDQTTQINLNEALLYNGKWDPVVTLPDFLQSFPKYLKYEQSVAKVVQGLLNELGSGKFDTEWRKRYDVAFGYDRYYGTASTEQYSVPVISNESLLSTLDQYEISLEEYNIKRLNELMDKVQVSLEAISGVKEMLDSEDFDSTTANICKVILDQNSKLLGMTPSNVSMESLSDSRIILSLESDNMFKRAYTILANMFKRMYDYIANLGSSAEKDIDKLDETNKSLSNASFDNVSISIGIDPSDLKTKLSTLHKLSLTSLSKLDGLVTKSLKSTEVSDSSETEAKATVAEFKQEMNIIMDMLTGNTSVDKTDIKVYLAVAKDSLNNTSIIKKDIMPKLKRSEKMVLENIKTNVKATSVITKIVTAERDIINNYFMFNKRLSTKLNREVSKLINQKDKSDV